MSSIQPPSKESVWQADGHFLARADRHRLHLCQALHLSEYAMGIGSSKKRGLTSSSASAISQVELPAAADQFGVLETSLLGSIRFDGALPGSILGLLRLSRQNSVGRRLVWKPRRLENGESTCAGSYARSMSIRLSVFTI